MPRSVFTEGYKAFLDVLVEARRTSRVTQVELAQRLGKTQPWVSSYENGIRRLDVIEFVAVARAIGAKPEKLFDKVLNELPRKLEI